MEICSSSSRKKKFHPRGIKPTFSLSLCIHAVVIHTLNILHRRPSLSSVPSGLPLWASLSAFFRLVIHTHHQPPPYESPRLGHELAMSTAVVMPSRFLVQTPIFSVSPSTAPPDSRGGACHSARRQAGPLHPDKCTMIIGRANLLQLQIRSSLEWLSLVNKVLSLPPRPLAPPAAWALSERNVIKMASNTGY